MVSRALSTPRAPALSLYFFQIAYFVKELRRKNLLAGELFPHTPKLLRDVKDKLLREM